MMQALLDGESRSGRRRRTRQALTWTGIGFGLVTAVGGILAWQSGVNLLYLLFASLAALFPLNAIVGMTNMWRLTACRRFPRTVRALEPFDYSIEVTNGKRTPAVGLLLEDVAKTGFRVSVGHCGVLGGGAAATVGVVGAFPRRGKVALSGLRISSRFPFGFVWNRKFVAATQEILVLPPRVGVGEMVRAVDAALEENARCRKGTGSDIYGVREYVPGEHAHRIHWRTSARTRKLMLMEFENSDRRLVTLVIDDSPKANGRDNGASAMRFEHAVAAATAITEELQRRGFDVGFVGSAGTVDAGCGPKHLRRLLRVFAVLERSPAGRVVPADVVEGTGVCLRFAVDGWVSRHRRDEIVFDMMKWDLRDGRFSRKADP